ncbi:MAG: tail fiber domain-containing protein [Roseiflexus sp.]|uniref:tail fiber domain-containing protein n=1 Tax=Roseiflexus sp. TaxID=2562120 RepID=UPI0025D8560B|nr:tail fiber domain-containing protein [Roseiflexus sp.]MCL6542704.1 tail fiber domain-containing protein [Roseiflexus sp.]
MQRTSLVALGLVLALVIGVGAWRVQAQDAEPDDVAPPTSLDDVMIPQSLAGSSFTYQGRLTSGGAPVNGQCDFQFSLFDAASAGTQIGSTQTAGDISVMNGLFTVAIDFGGGAFNGAARWLEIGVRCPAGSGSYTTLSPRQTLTAAPYALALPGLWTQQNATSPNLIGGFSGNSVTSGVVGATIGGGGESGFPNRVTDSYGTVGGGGNNQAGNNAGPVNDRSGATVGGGIFNTASGEHAAVGGGRFNTASGSAATVGGGDDNTASGSAATVGGGDDNTASGQYATVGGGDDNTASGSDAAVGGGYLNIASGEYATVGGGRENTAAGNYSFASGRRAKANNPGCFVWGDSTNADVACSNDNRTIFRSSGGYYIYTNASLTSGMFLSGGGSAWNAVSNRALKENFAPVDTRRLLARLAQIEIATWNYRSQEPAIRHIGPMADEFNALVDGLGGEGKDYINSLDADGVALAAIQGLYGLVQEKDAEIAALRADSATMKAEITSLRAENAKLNERLAAIEQALQANGAPVHVAASPAVLPQGGIALLGMLGGLVIGGAIMYRRRAGGGR